MAAYLDDGPMTLSVPPSIKQKQQVQLKSHCKLAVGEDGSSTAWKAVRTTLRYEEFQDQPGLQETHPNEEMNL